MADDVKTGARPLDPSRNAEDVMGEAASAGITTGGIQQTSATPGDVKKDESRVKGGIIDDPTKVPVDGQEKTEYSDTAYDKQVADSMSGVHKQIGNDAASEEEHGGTVQKLPNNKTGQAPELAAMGNDTQEDAEKDIRTSEAPFTGEENLGQQDAVGGSESAPETDDDVGEMQARVGLGSDKDGEDPQEVSIADAMDKAEEYHRTH